MEKIGLDNDKPNGGFLPIYKMEKNTAKHNVTSGIKMGMISISDIFKSKTSKSIVQ